MAKRASKTEIPKKGDTIEILYADHVQRGLQWNGPMIFIHKFVDPDQCVIGKSLVYHPDFFARTTGSDGKILGGLFCCRWDEVEFWRACEIETMEEMRERVSKHSLADRNGSATHRYKSLSSAKIGPAFKQEPIDESLRHPEDGSKIEVGALREERDCLIYLPSNFLDSQVGTFFRAADRFCDYYGVPTIPFRRWIRFRELREDGTAKEDWQPGPHYEGWKKADLARRQQEVREENKERYERGKEYIKQLPTNEPDIRVRLERLRNVLATVSTRFDTSLDSEGGSEFYGGALRSVLQDEMQTLERALNSQPSNASPQKQKSTSEQIDTMQPLFVPGEVWIATVEQHRQLIAILIAKGFLREEEGWYIWIKKQTDLAYLIVKLKGKVIHSDATRLQQLQFVRIQKNGVIQKPDAALAERFGSLCRKIDNPNEDANPSQEIIELTTTFLSTPGGVPPPTKNDPSPS